MNKQEALKILILIESIYKGYLTKNETVTFWLKFSPELDWTIVMTKLKRHIRTNPYPPTISDLTEETVNRPFHWLQEYKKI
ncbi:hypothetical protein BIV60_08040 [Bacillus sp. MUM 116]|uniref:replicative helicase loader/inhibitor n=1 Tax=Bacillus sp. MUM 116 TaxID=1678002 RepID=UPI0008F5BCA2|nr:replicative helicase loader/inhibitor [Bacillus sp. MUM 116]OIK15696.1 hypothetical protein BIV60_08040 [Bacillus sp. MUM 116]